MNYYEKHLGDYAKDAGHLSMLEHGAYNLLIDRYYASEAGIPAEAAYDFSRAHSKIERQATDKVLKQFFILVDGVWKKNRIEEEIAKAQRKISAAQINGTKGGRPKSEPKTNPEQTQEKPTGLLLGSDLETQPKALQTPDSRLQNKEQESLSSSSTVTVVFDHWKQTFGHPKARLDGKRTKAIAGMLKLFGVDDLLKSISGYRKSRWHMGANDRKKVFDDIELFMRDAKHVEAGLRLFDDPNAEFEGMPWT